MATAAAASACSWPLETSCATNIHTLWCLARTLKERQEVRARQEHVAERLYADEGDKRDRLADVDEVDEDEVGEADRVAAELAVIALCIRRGCLYRIDEQQYLREKIHLTMNSTTKMLSTHSLTFGIK